MIDKTTTNPRRPLLLASTSRYRAELLRQLALPFDVAAPGVDETPLPGEAPAATALRLAAAKARAVASRHVDALVIGADQVADLDGQPVGKPGTHAGAVAH
ncbi:MAG: Maf family protein, partial [Betaproteobacteria bacterium]